MDIKKRIITAENFCSSDGEFFASELIKSPEGILAFVNDFIGDDLRFRQRASWVMIALAKKHEQALLPHLPLLINTLLHRQENSIKRNILRLFQYVTLPEQFHEKLINLCFDILNNKDEAIAVQVFAMTVLRDLIKDYPELQKELMLIIEEKIDLASAGYQSRAKKILNAYHKKR